MRVRTKSKAVWIRFIINITACLNRFLFYIIAPDSLTFSTSKLSMLSNILGSRCCQNADNPRSNSVPECIMCTHDKELKLLLSC